MPTFGDPRTFAIELRTDDLESAVADAHLVVADVYLIVSGIRVGDGTNPMLGTFVNYLAGFLLSHREHRHDFDFTTLSKEAAFAMLDRIAETGEPIEGIMSSDVWHYHKLSDLDVAVDGWSIYVYDTPGTKNIICKARPGCVGTSDAILCNGFVSASLPRREFLLTITSFISPFQRKWPDLLRSNRADGVRQRLLDDMLAFMQDEQGLPREGFTDYSEADVEECARIVDSYLQEMSGTRDRAAILKSIERTVLRLNDLNSRCGGCLIETGQREDLCEIILVAARQAGSGTDEDLTEAWREW